MNNYNQTTLPVMRTTGYRAQSALDKYEESEITANPLMTLPQKVSLMRASSSLEPIINQMNNYNQTTLPVMRTTGYGLCSTPEKYEESDITVNTFTQSTLGCGQSEVCCSGLIPRLYKLWKNMSSILINTIALQYRAQSWGEDDDSYGRHRNAATKPAVRYVRTKQISVDTIVTARQYLKASTVVKKLSHNAYWSDPQLQGWAYNVLLDNCEAKLTILCKHICRDRFDLYYRLFSLLDMVSHHADEKHSYKLKNVKQFFKMQVPGSTEKDIRRTMYRAQSGFVQSVCDQFCGYGLLIKMFHDISKFVMALRRVSLSELTFVLYELSRSTSLESAFVCILKLLHKLNCTQVYLVMLGVSVAQISQHLKRRFSEKKREQPEFMAQSLLTVGTITSFYSGMRNFSTMKRFAMDIYELLKHTPVLSMLFDAHATLAAIHRDIPGWMADVSARYVDQGVFKAGSDYNYSLEITEVMKQGLMFQTALQKARVSQASMGAFNLVFRLAQEMARETKAFAVTPQARPEPLVIFMKGSTGQGKSVLAQTIPVDLFQKLNINYNPEVDYYRRNETQDHWDGYNHQKVVCFDDMLQSTDPQDLKTALLDFLHLKNELPYPLKMADLSAKSNTWFTSPLILITSNNDVERGPPIKSLGAIMRRRDIFVEVRMKREFLNNGVADVDKITQYAIEQYGEITMCPEVYIFDLYTSGTDEAHPQFVKSLTYDQLIDLAVVHWHKLHAKRSMIDTYIKRKNPHVDVKPELVAEKKESRFLQFRQWTVSQLRTMGTKIGYCTVEAQRLCRKAVDYVRDLPWLTRRNQLWYSIAGTIALVISVAFAYYMWQKSDDVAESMISGDMATKRVVSKTSRFSKKKAESNLSGDQATKRVAVTRKFTRTIPHRAEGTSDVKATMVMQKLINTNMVRLQFRNNRLYGLMLTNNLLLAPSHLLQSGLEDPDLLLNDEILSVIKPAGGRYDFALGDVDMVVDPEIDVAFIKLSHQCPSFPSVIHQFITDAELSKVNVKKLLHGACGTSETEISRIMSVLVDGKFHGKVSYLAPHSEHKAVMLNIIRSVGYTAVTEDGDCGTLVAHMDSTVQNKLIGFHVCAYKDQGHATIVTQEIIREAMSELGVITSAPVDLGMPCAQADVDQNLMIIGGTPSGNTRYIPHRTIIKPSMFAGEYVDPVTAPADLSTRGADSALAIATSKNTGFEKPIPKWMLDQAATDVINMIMALPSDYKDSARLLTIDEAINGIPGDDYIRQIDVSTSPGYPYIEMDQGKDGKKGFLESTLNADGSKHYTPGEFLENKLQDRLQGLKQGEMRPTFFLDTLKDERRPLDKVASKNTRLFNVAPMDLNLALRIYCGKFIAHLMSNSLYGEVSVGINPHSVAWKLLLGDMLTVGDKFIAGDYSKYDKRLPWQCVSYIPQIIAKFLGGYEKELDVLIRSTFNGCYVSKDYTYYKIFGNPSGNTLTTIVNSIVNCMLVRICYLKLGQEHGIDSLYEFNQHIKLKVFGDDNVMSVSDAIPWFSMRTLISAMKDIGVEYGAATKDGDVYEYLPVSGISYLKRGFRVMGSSVYAPLPAHIIKETLNWVRRCPDEDAVMIQIIESAKKEWFHHGSVTYAKEVGQLQQLAWKHNLRLPGTVYATWVQQFNSA